MAANVPEWNVSGDWFDVCKCNIPCPCEFAQTPTYGDCDAILVYHIRNGNYGKTPLNGLNVLFLSYFKGNIWAGAKANNAIFFDEKASEEQRDALNMIFTGKGGGFMAEFAKLIGHVHGIQYVLIKFNLADDLSSWSVEIPGKVSAKVEALTGPMTPPGKRVQIINPPGSEVGPGAIATCGRAVTDIVDAKPYKWERKGNSSKHIPFNWSGP
jgi:hypothetical protein